MSDKTDLSLLWDFGDPAASGSRFRGVLDTPEAQADPAFRVEVLTQIARALGLQSKLEEARSVLDEASELLPPESSASAWVEIERGRFENSSGNPQEARQHFLEAWAGARRRGQEALAIDAAHMIAIGSDEAESLAWNQKALELASESADPKARRWTASLLNNIGWTHHSAGRFSEALVAFERALEARLAQGQAEPTRIAKWCVARCLRSLGRVEEALARLRDIEGQADDGFVDEEIGECLWTLGRREESRAHFTQAFDKLSKVPGLAQNEPERLQSLRDRAG
ncbi:MAG TPA: tetratricopeptide repeat protein [Fimbriimonadaceae bacterium]|nr:tetratricopeptide repeat protein [Fimbriimonadaceae bacterium]